MAGPGVNASSNIPSGAKSERTGLTALLATLRSGDTVVLWRPDRLGRSLKDPIYLVRAARRRLRRPAQLAAEHRYCADRLPPPVHLIGGLTSSATISASVPAPVCRPPAHAEIRADARSG
ncbi:MULTISPECIES: recombinase family protein [Paraburkholderia]|uniref:recombinase family protein n=1 Tax=Paraburkholderia TaxID=1822464 RepID=UPI001EF84D46|nr:MULTISPECIES: recombinase family protein [Paraburkholderia]